MKFNCFYIVIAVDSVLTDSIFIPGPLPDDGRLNFTGLSAKYGHKAEEYKVVTEDGYILGLFRLPGKRKLPILLMHGLQDSADSFILRGNRSLAITLANRGYDVWLGNTRGNRYSRQHITLNPDTDLSFWDYSFHEHGYYDLPAITDYVLNATGQEKLQSIGMSQGTTCFFVLGSLRPEYNEKFKIFIALAPIAFLNNIKPPLSVIIDNAPLINELLIRLEMEELVTEKGAMRKFIEMICNQGAISYKLCGGIIFSLTGTDKKRFEPDFLPIAIGHYPAAFTRKELMHLGQVSFNMRFAQYDYGPTENLKRYGVTAPPEYNLKNNTIKTVLFVGKNDKFCPIPDAEHLRSLLPNVVKYHLMAPKRWNHLDFVWGNDMTETLFPLIFPLLEKYS